MPVANYGMAGTELGGKIYIFGGYPSNMSADTYAFDPTGPSWTKKASMTVARRMACAAAGNVIYVIGGEGANSAELSVVEAYDTIADTWSTKAPLPGADWRPSCAAVAGVVYVMSGSQTLAYNEADNVWTSKAAAPTARTQGAAVAVGGIIYKLGGSANLAACYWSTRVCPIVEAYDPVADSWSTKAPMPTARTPLAATAINGIIYAIGGYGLSGNVLAVEAYDPATDVWTTKAPLSSPRVYSFAATIAGDAYVMGSSSGGPTASVQVFTP